MPIPSKPRGDGKPTGKGTAGKNDVYDPHPSNEEHYDRSPRPGGDGRIEERDIGPNNAVHDGHPKPKPRNAETS